MDSSVNESRNDNGTDIQLSIGDLVYYEGMTDEQRQRIPEWLRQKADAELDRVKSDAAVHVRIPSGALGDQREATREDIGGLKTKNKAAFDKKADEANRLVGEHIRLIRERFAGQRRKLAKRYTTDANGRQHGFNREDAAWPLGMSESTYRDIEKGGKNINVGEAATIAEFYAVPPEILLSPIEGDSFDAEIELLMLFHGLPSDRRKAFVDAIVTLTNSTH